jgi:hypothetical protein
VLVAEALTLISPFTQTAAPPAEVEKLDVVKFAVELDIVSSGRTPCAMGAAEDRNNASAAKERNDVAAAEDGNSIAAPKERHNVSRREGILRSKGWREFKLPGEKRR